MTNKPDLTWPLIFTINCVDGKTPNKFVLFGKNTIDNAEVDVVVFDSASSKYVSYSKVVSDTLHSPLKIGMVKIESLSSFRGNGITVISQSEGKPDKRFELKDAKEYNGIVDRYSMYVEDEFTFAGNESLKFELEKSFSYYQVYMYRFS